MLRPPPASTLFPYTTLFRSRHVRRLQRPRDARLLREAQQIRIVLREGASVQPLDRHALSRGEHARLDRKSTRLNSSHVEISYAVFCLKKKNRENRSGGARRA